MYNSISTTILFLLILVQSIAQNRGDIVYFDLDQSLTQQQLIDLFDSQGVPSILLGIQNGVDIYKVKYKTIDFDSTSIIDATGIVTIPNGYSCPMALASFGHGLTLKNDGVPTGSITNVYRQIAAGYGGAGYICTAPDYIRHGPDGEPGIQSFMHAYTEAAATIDLMRAARTFASDNNLTMNGQVFVSGYSQGGHSSMATAKEIQANFSSEFNLIAVAPGGGTYDLSGIAADSLASPTRTTIEPHAFTLIVRSYLNMYSGVIPGINYTFEGIFKSPYDSLLLEILDREHPNSNVNVLLDIPNMMLEDSLRIAFLNDPNHPIRTALARNDLYNWVPQMPLRMYHCGGDIENPIDNVIFTDSIMNLNGAPATELVLVDPDLGHRECGQWAIIGAKAWFDSLRDECSVNTAEINIQNKTTIAPNPFSEQTLVQFDDTSPISGLNLYSITGKLLRTYNGIIDNPFIFHQENLKPGVYLLEIIGSDRKLIRLIVQ